MDKYLMVDIEKALRNYSTIINAEAEKLEILGFSGTKIMFEKAATIYGLAEKVLDCKNARFIKVVPIRNT